MCKRTCMTVTQQGRKKKNVHLGEVTPNVVRRVENMLSRPLTRAISQLHSNEEITRALNSIQPLFHQDKLQWQDHGRRPDCQFTSFIHASKKTIPVMAEIMDVRRV